MIVRSSRRSFCNSIWPIRSKNTSSHSTNISFVNRYVQSEKSCQLEEIPKIQSGSQSCPARSQAAQQKAGVSAIIVRSSGRRFRNSMWPIRSTKTSSSGKQRQFHVQIDYTIAEIFAVQTSSRFLIRSRQDRNQLPPHHTCMCMHSGSWLSLLPPAQGRKHWRQGVLCPPPPPPQFLDFIT